MKRISIQEMRHQVGQLLNASHESSRTLFQNRCAELDALVELLARLPGVYEARLFGEDLAERLWR